MNTSIPKSFFALGLLLLLGLACGCQKGSGAPKIDIQAQIQGLKSPDADTRATACAELAKAGPGAAPAVSALIESLKDSDPVVRRVAAYALSEIGPAAKEALPALKGLLNEPDRQLIASVIVAIRAIDPKNSGDLQSPVNVTQ